MDDNELRKRTCWLNNLKVGDEVAINVYKDNNWVVKKIKSISKDGFRLEGNYPVWNDGTYMGNYVIYPCTEKINDVIEKSELIKVLSNYNISRLDIEKLREIRRIIEGETKKIVPVLDGQIETRLKINQYLISLQMAGMRIKTKEAAVLHAIAQAERVPELEKEIMELKELIKELVEMDEYYRS